LKTEHKGGQKRSLFRGRGIGVYPGQYYDTETGLHYNYFRYYNPQTGRYITPDPIGLEGGINLFVYVQGNPINRIDPLGLQSPSASGLAWRLGGLGLGIVLELIPSGVTQAIGFAVLGAVVLSIPGDTVCRIERSEKERCHKVWDECIEECSAVLPTPRRDQGNPFFNCVNSCLERNNCLGKL
jgi:RHS repeat-associated protein